jgi:hypothetical protein
MTSFNDDANLGVFPYNCGGIPMPSAYAANMRNMTFLPFMIPFHKNHLNNHLSMF